MKKPAIEDSGYKPCRVNKNEDTGKIDDRIIVEIKRSRFILADLTHGDNGVRRSVYYEVEFARGLQTPGFFTCRKELIPEVHFDIRQYPIIDWKGGSPENLREKLGNRIIANVNYDPENHRKLTI